jgi:hypothetical protein
MNVRSVFMIGMAVLLLPGMSRAQEPGAETDAPKGARGVMKRILKPLEFFQRDSSSNIPAAKWKNLALTIGLDPIPLKLSENRQIKVTLQLVNNGKRLVQLDFPTTQRIEVLLKSNAGKTIEKWSDDQSFSSEPTIVVLNPGERLEYSISLATRDMLPGEQYEVEAFFPNYTQLSAKKTVRGDK